MGLDKYAVYRKQAGFYFGGLWLAVTAFYGFHTKSPLLRVRNLFEYFGMKQSSGQIQVVHV